MIIRELFDYIDEIKPNAFSNDTKTVWLNEVEGMVQTEAFLLSEKEIVEYRWSADVTTPVTFPDDRTLGIADKTVLQQFRPGGKLTFTPPAPYADNAKTGIVIQGFNADGLLFPAGSFPTLGSVAASTELSYDGSSIKLLVEPPHSKLYAEYVMARIDYANGEYDKYENSMQMFNAFWGEFMRWFARTHCPAGRRQ